MTSDELRAYLKTYRTDSFAGGLIPFDFAYNESLNSGNPRVVAQSAGVYAVLNAFVNYVEIRETDGRGEGALINAHTGERA